MAKEEPVPFLHGEVPVVGASQPDGQAPVIEEFSGPAATTNGGQTIETDAIVIGAGFSGITAIHRLRKAGFKVKCFEAGGDFGGVWYWNRYPGARVDSEAPFYQLNIPEVYRHWSFSERFPGHAELRRYMAHIDQTLDLRKDTYFNARVNDCSWDESSGRWTVKTEQGHVTSGKYLFLCTGLLHRTFTPDFPGLSQYKGEVYHSGAWNEDFSAKGKKIGLIGAGATAVQITQELGKQADELTVLLRRPSHCLPMKQRNLSADETNQLKTWYATLFAAGRASQAGFPGNVSTTSALDVSAEQRLAMYTETWERGGFSHTGTFNDTVIKPEANAEAYAYWRKRVCERLTDPEKQKIMAPEKANYYIYTKRMPLEQDYYDVLNQPHVRLHDLAQAPLKTFTPTGMQMADGREYAFDAVVLATGFDSFTGSLTQMGLKNTAGKDLRDLWADGASTYLGLTISGFPNCFLVYSPQAPTALSNGTTIIEAQVETIVALIQKLELEGAKSVHPTPQAQAEWAAGLDAMAGHTLMQFTDSWWNASNVPGKKAQNMNYIAGIANYEKTCREAIAEWKGFEVVGGAKAA